MLILRPEFNGSVSWKPLDETNIGALIATLLFVSLAVQSSLEVFVSNFRSLAKLKIHQRIAFYQRELDKIKEELKITSDDDLKQKKFGSILQNLENEKLKYDEYRAETKEIINFVGLLVGVIISIGGVRVLQPFVHNLDLVSWQKEIFHASDILLTAGLISGGSEGIHQLTALYKTVTMSATQLAEDKGNPTPPV